MSAPVRKAFPFDSFEPKWQKHWLEAQTFRAANPGEPGAEKPKYYALDMFPYPSAAGLHVGHPVGYTATDIVSRYKRMRGFNVLHPMGWDAFGLPAEQYAVKTGTHPSITTRENIATFRRQLQALGLSYDWSREISTTHPKYVRWTQWIFLQLYKRGLAYVSDAPVWYCPGLGTVLANEEVLNTSEGPRSERGNFPVERKPLRQWVLKITDYAERLLADLDTLDWPQSLKEMQRNWIGKSVGAEIEFELELENAKERIAVFTTRPDTLFGATYLVLSPEHPLVQAVTTSEQRTEVDKYIAQARNKSDLVRTDLAKEKSGVFTGGHAKHPVTGKLLPIWISDYVLMSYGTGAIMAVPAHDERDRDFARQYGLNVLQVVEVEGKGETPECFTGEGIAINSDFLDEMRSADAKKTMIEWLEKHGKGRGRITYKLRDWLFSRQRYWGEPFPILWKDGEHRPLEEKDLPLLLPEMKDFQPTPEGLAPLAKAKEWLNLPDGSVRETNTMPNWAGSCWYYLRFLDARNDGQLVNPEAERYWMGAHGVDLYIGGAEHAVLHLLYARFWHKVLYDLGVVSTAEPFYKLVNQGMILGEDGQKMSKSRGNVITTEEVVNEHGADSLRLFEMFMGPLTQLKPWSTKGVEGVHRFLARVWRLVMEETQEGGWALSSQLTSDAPSPETLRALHQTIAKVTGDIETLAFNTAISQMMIFVNHLTKEEKRSRAAIEPLVLVLAPFAPHIAEELWSLLGHSKTLTHEPWPQADARLLQADEVEVVVQINGRVRGHLTLPTETPQSEIESRARALPEFVQWAGDQKIKKVVYVPGKLINFVCAS